ncbi:MAG: hypothetical protein GYA55_03190 [SAR324 cluster bacterium]|uniref:Uncharacterized protein n=1 Tax=SAR324 cluster bacterium TaxID=2024889 RepID=A0A7X9FPZ4_9DELT|nr:hypothetical protein [SAR324 cluster bacterium]
MAASILVIIPWLACLANDSITGSSQFLINRPLEISITEAIALAQAYVRERKVDLSEQHINSATLKYDEGKYATGEYWSIRWS